MAGRSYHEEFINTMNLSAPQQGGEAAALFTRVGGGTAVAQTYRAANGGGGEFDTMNLAAPHRAGGGEAEGGAQFNTANLGAPVRMPMGGVEGREELTNERGHGTTAPPPAHSGQSPMMMMMEMQSGGKKDERSGGPMHKGLLIAMLALRVAAAVSLIIAIPVLASDSQTIDSVTFTYQHFSSTKYAMAASILGALYSIHEVVSLVVRLILGSFLLPGTTSLWVSYIGDQIVVVLLLTSASAATNLFKLMHDFTISPDVVTTYCDVLSNFCDQGDAAIAMVYIGFVFIAASLVISSYCFYKKKM